MAFWRWGFATLFFELFDPLVHLPGHHNKVPFLLQNTLFDVLFQRIHFILYFCLAILFDIIKRCFIFCLPLLFYVFLRILGYLHSLLPRFVNHCILDILGLRLILSRVYYCLALRVRIILRRNLLQIPTKTVDLALFIPNLKGLEIGLAQLRFLVGNFK